MPIWKISIASDSEQIDGHLSDLRGSAPFFAGFPSTLLENHGKHPLFFRATDTAESAPPCETVQIVKHEKTPNNGLVVHEVSHKTKYIGFNKTQQTHQQLKLLESQLYNYSLSKHKTTIIVDTVVGSRYPTKAPIRHGQAAGHNTK